MEDLPKQNELFSFSAGLALLNSQEHRSIDQQRGSVSPDIRTRLNLSISKHSPWEYIGQIHHHVVLIHLTFGFQFVER